MPPARRLSVSSVAQLDSASLSFSSLSGWAQLGLRDRFLDLTDEVWRVRAFGDFLSYCLVAEGAVDIAAEPEVSVWDLAPLDILVREAGGTFTSLDGTAGPHGGSAVATNGLLHDQVLARLSADIAERVNCVNTPLLSYSGVRYSHRTAPTTEAAVNDKHCHPRERLP